MEEVQKDPDEQSSDTNKKVYIGGKRRVRNVNREQVTLKNKQRNIKKQDTLKRPGFASLANVVGKRC